LGKIEVGDSITEDSKLDDLINQAGEHLERTRAEILPRIEKLSKRRQQEESLRMLRCYLKEMETVYHLLITLRDRSMQQSIASLTEASWAGLWDDDD
jgi:hypothetical protein